MSTRFETQTQNDERPVRGQTLREGEVHENREGGRVREPQRLGMSQGTMIREPRYGGGAHPKYRSSTEEAFLNSFFSPPSHGSFGLVTWYTWLSDGNRIFAIFLQLVRILTR